ncbi:hypothetical protein [Massilia suwonensis]|uniref:Extracellular repeat, HAF family n=1 Tax=Massilia suwonensis TaxID=648895 RepID=A0ABW0MKB0_9BURK
MKLHSTTQRALRKPALRNNILTGLFPLLTVAGGAAAAPTAPAAPAAPPVYSVINLDPEGAIAYLNENGQAAVGSFVFGTSGFFDGNRVVPFGVPGDTSIAGLNNRGVVTGETSEGTGPFRRFYEFTWSLGRGMRALPNVPSRVWGINDQDQVVGDMTEASGIQRAVRFEPGGAITPLGPVPLGVSAVRAIANTGVSGGYADDGSGIQRATLWDARGRPTNLGTLGGSIAGTAFVNERGEAAGTSYDANDANDAGFFWSRGSGMVPIGTRNGGSRTVADLNDRGEVVGDTATAAGSTAYQWSRARGLVPLPRAGALESDVFDINNRSEIVGGVRRPSGWRAALWRGPGAPIDLNTRLQRIPAGLVLSHAVAINEAGTILALSNAGLVMLRPGTKGTDAPVLGPFTGLPDSVTVGQELRVSLGFIDNAPGQVHTATVDWADGCASPSPLVREAYGKGEVVLQHRFCAPGARTVVLRVTDSGGRTTEARREILVNEPGLAALSARGKLAAAGAAGPGRSQPLRFTLWAPLGDTRGAGKAGENAALVLHGPFAFRSDSVAVTGRAGATLRLEGTGRYNGRAGYRFQLDAADGDNARGGRDQMRVRISHVDAAGTEVLDYDSAGTARAGAKMAAALAGTAAPGQMSPVDGALTLSN